MFGGIADEKERTAGPELVMFKCPEELELQRVGKLLLDLHGTCRL